MTHSAFENKHVGKQLKYQNKVFTCATMPFYMTTNLFTKKPIKNDLNIPL